MRRNWWRSPVALLLYAALVLVGVAYLVVSIITHEKPNYTRIDDGLYQGGDVASPPWRTRAVLNLCESPDPYTRDVHVWEPIPDAAPAPSLAWLRERVEWIDTQRQAGKRVFVHCRNGVSRSGIVVVAYLMHKNRWSRDEALEYIRARRPITRPQPGVHGTTVGMGEGCSGKVTLRPRVKDSPPPGRNHSELTLFACVVAGRRAI